MRSSTYFLIINILLIGCGTETHSDLPEHIREVENLTVYSEDSDPAFDIELTNKAIFAESDEVFWGQIIRNIAVDEADRVYVVDHQQNTIHVYNPDGSYLESIGREGEGPGEFQGIQDLAIHDGKIHILDNRLSKISVMDLNTLEHQRDYNVALEDHPNNKPSWYNRAQELALNYRPSAISVRADDSYFILFSEDRFTSVDNLEERTYEASIFSPGEQKYQKHDLLTFKWTGRLLVDEEGPTSTALFNIAYKRSSQFDTQNDLLVHGWTDDMLFKFYDLNGEYRRSFYYPYSKVSLLLDDVLDYYENAGNQFHTALENDELPETWPAFNSVIMDDENRLWISTFTDDPNVFEWWVTDKDGELLATFHWPRNRDLQQVRNGYAYTIETDFETGVNEVVKYKIEMNE